MQSYQPFFLNYPPPPILTRESIINEGLKLLQESKTDEQWLKNWLDRKQEEKRLSSNRLSLSDYRQKLIHHAHLLQQYEHALQSCNHENLSQLKNQIEQSSQFIYDSNHVSHIEKQIRRRNSKRARLRRQKDKELVHSEDQIIHQSIQNEKPLEEKIQDINLILQIIEQLKQLKHQRQQQQSISTDTDQELADIENMCHSKLAEYKTQTESKTLTELFNYLFNNEDRSFYESTNPNARHFLRAHENINNLVEIRQEWDRYSTDQPTSSDTRIPLTWHEPQTPCDANWTQYIFHKNDN